MFEITYIFLNLLTRANVLQAWNAKINVYLEEENYGKIEKNMFCLLGFILLSEK